MWPCWETLMTKWLTCFDIKSLDSCVSGYRFESSLYIKIMEDLSYDPIYLTQTLNICFDNNWKLPPDKQQKVYYYFRRFSQISYIV